MESQITDRFVDLPDCEGNTLKLVEHDGDYYVAFPGVTGRVTALEKGFVKAEDTDIWICGYPKCGTHWAWDIIHMIMAGNSEHIGTDKSRGFVEITPTDLTTIPRPRILNSHLLPKRIHQDNLDSGRFIYLIRNPKDVAVSFYHHAQVVPTHYTGTWNGFLSLFMEGKVEYGSWFDHTSTWLEHSKTHTNMLVVKYEDLKKDLPGKVGDIAQFLGRPISEALAKDIANQCEFGVMKMRKKVSPVGHPRPLRKGQIGDWKNYFTVTQNEKFNEWYLQEMKGSDLVIEFE